MFQSAPLVRAATRTVVFDGRRVCVSIRAARESGDTKPFLLITPLARFNPRRS
jgi:hypothetical protein